MLIKLLILHLLSSIECQETAPDSSGNSSVTLAETKAGVNVRAERFCSASCPRPLDRHAACHCFHPLGMHCRPYFAHALPAFRLAATRAANERRAARAARLANMHALNYSALLEYVSLCAASNCEHPRRHACAGTGQHPHAAQLVFRYRQVARETVEKIVVKALAKWDYESSALYQPGFTSFGCMVLYLYDGLLVQPSFYVTMVCTFGSSDSKPSLQLNGMPCSHCQQNMSCNDDFNGLCGSISPIPIDNLFTDDLNGAFNAPTLSHLLFGFSITLLCYVLGFV